MGLSTGAAIIGSAVIGAGSSILGGNKAAKAQKQAAALQAKQFEETKALLSPYTSTGESALGKYNTAVGLNGREEQQKFYDEFEHDPGWEAANQAGLDSVDDRYRLSGSSGGNMRAALYEHGQRNLLAAYNTRLQQLGGLVDTGRSAASALAGYGQQSAQAQGGLLANAGQSQANGIIGAGNAISGGLSNLGQYNMWQQGMGSGMTAGTAANGGWTTSTVNNANRYFG
jgi:hypothetical protein